jgi:acyl-CoA thioester hydrolase
VQTRVAVRWSDEDGFGHVNNAAYLTYLEEGRDRLFDAVFPDSAYDFVLARIEIDYRVALTHRDAEVLVDVDVEEYGRSSVRTREVVRTRDGRVAAEARTVAVAYDHALGRPRPLRDEELASLAASMSATTT